MTSLTEPFRVVLADPAWIFGDALPGPKRGAAKHYSVMTTGDICKMELPPIADDAWLFMWRVSAMLEDALRVVNAWGFTVKTEAIWAKLSRTGEKQHFGMGRYLRAAHEGCLVATRGKVQPKVRNVRSLFYAPVQEHSRKPAVFYEMIEALADGPYVELFARHRREGWTSIGDQLDSSVEQEGARQAQERL